MNDFTAMRLVEELVELNRTMRDIRHILSHLYKHDDVVGGEIHQLPLGDGERSTSNVKETKNTMPTLVPIQPGQSPKFQVTPTFSGAAFTLDGTKAAVTSSDPANFPVALDLIDDPTGATFVAAIPSTANPPAGGEQITVTWTYTNLDGTVATVTGTVTEQGIVDDVVGGTFNQVA